MNHNDLAWNAFLARRHMPHGSRRAELEQIANGYGVDPDALGAFIAVETLARPRLLQWLEFMSFLILSGVNPRRARRMTLGPAQIRVAHMGVESGRTLVIAGLRLMKWKYSCDLAAAILADAPCDEIPDLCRWYNGPRCNDNYTALVLRLVDWSRSGSV